MTGLEIVATAAALAQVVEYAHSIARVLRGLHKSAKSGPSWVQGYCIHLDEPIITVGNLSSFESLDECSRRIIDQVLRSIEAQASKLSKILANSGSIKAIWIQLARATEADELFRSLDQNEAY